jgi:hypothetical protein
MKTKRAHLSPNQVRPCVRRNKEHISNLHLLALQLYSAPISAKAGDSLRGHQANLDIRRSATVTLDSATKC